MRLFPLAAKRLARIDQRAGRVVVSGLLPMKELFLSATFQELWQGKDPFQETDRLKGKVFREMPSRRTIRFTVDGKAYFAKIHHGIGWREIAKNLLHLKRPVLGAQCEWVALAHLHRIGLETMTPVAFGLKGLNPARRRSFIVTEELAGTESLENFCKDWASHPPPFQLRKALVERVASMVRDMHASGLNHRDCYICHFHLDVSSGRDHVDPEDFHLHVIDLHRAQLRRRIPQRWIVKDLAGLYFSAMDIGLTETDCLRFIKTYEQKSLRAVFGSRRRFWRRIERAATSLYKKHFGRSR